MTVYLLAIWWHAGMVYRMNFLERTSFRPLSSVRVLYGHYIDEILSVGIYSQRRQRSPIVKNYVHWTSVQSWIWYMTDSKYVGETLMLFLLLNWIYYSLPQHLMLTAVYARLPVKPYLTLRLQVISANHMILMTHLELPLECLCLWFTYCFVKSKCGKHCINVSLLCANLVFFSFDYIETNSGCVYGRNHSNSVL